MILSEGSQSLGMPSSGSNHAHRDVILSERSQSLGMPSNGSNHAHTDTSFGEGSGSWAEDLPGPLSCGLSEVHEPEHLDYYYCYFHSDVISDDVTQAAGADLDIHVLQNSGRVTC